MTTGTQRQYADHLDVSESYVSRLKRQGKLVLVEGGLVDFEQSDILVAGSRDPNKEGGRERWRREKGRPAAGDVAASAAGKTDPDLEDEPDAARATPRASNELYDQRLRAQIKTAERQSQIADIELHERAGSLMSVAVFKDRMHAYGRTVRDTVQGIEARMAPHLDAEHLRLLRQEIQSTLHELDRRVAAESRVKREAGATEPA